MFCRYCGVEVKEHYAYCPGCGMYLSNAAKGGAENCLEAAYFDDSEFRNYRRPMDIESRNLATLELIGSGAFRETDDGPSREELDNDPNDKSWYRYSREVRSSRRFMAEETAEEDYDYSEDETIAPPAYYESTRAWEQAELEKTKRGRSKREQQISFCENCGSELPPFGGFCTQCGTQIDRETVIARRLKSRENKVASYLALNIFATILCCMPLGIVGIVFSASAISAARAGDRQCALQRAKVAKIFFWIAFLLGFAYFVFGFFSAYRELITEFLTAFFDETPF